MCLLFLNVGSGFTAYAVFPMQFFFTVMEFCRNFKLPERVMPAIHIKSKGATPLSLQANEVHQANITGGLLGACTGDALSPNIGHDWQGCPC